MPERRGPARPDPVLYPDVARAGSLHQALQAEFDRVGHRLTALPERPPGWRYVGARVETAQRHTSIVLGSSERVFTMQFWLSTGVGMAGGNTPDLSAAAGATESWQRGARVRALHAAWPFTHFTELAEAHERGEAADFTWRRYQADPRLRSFVDLAIREPRLRALLPFTSMQRLSFTRTAGYPHSGAYPWVIPSGHDRYAVFAPDGRNLGTADPAGAVALVLSALPPPSPDQPTP